MRYGQKAGRQAINRVVGTGSREHVVGLEDRMVLETVFRSTGVKKDSVSDGG